MDGDVRWWSVFAERILLCWFLVCLVFARGSNEIGGPVGSSGLSLTRDGSPYVVRLDLDVAEDGVLKIEAGVEMLFMPGVGINVKGQLHASVTEMLDKEKNGASVLLSFTSFHGILVRPHREDRDDGSDGRGMAVEGLWPSLRLSGGGEIGFQSSGGSPHSRILMTAATIPKGMIQHERDANVRLVDGPSPAVGRLQLYHKSKWRSVCTNSRNWTVVDFQVACRHLGFGGGTWYRWYDHRNHSRHLVFEAPNCKGNEDSLFKCQWESRQMGSGGCDLYPDIGIECTPLHNGTNRGEMTHWKGLSFHNAHHRQRLTSAIQLYEKDEINSRYRIRVNESRRKEITNEFASQFQVSDSYLHHVDVEYAGVGRQREAVAAVQVWGVPPQVEGTAVKYSAYHGMNVSMPDAPVVVQNSSFVQNRGYGLYVNSSHGAVLVLSSELSGNGADGLKYVHHNREHDTKFMNTNSYHDMCRDSIPAGQSYPVRVIAQQLRDSNVPRNCLQTFVVNRGVLTVHFVHMYTDEDGSGQLDVYDGMDDILLGSFRIKNGSYPASITSLRTSIRLKFTCPPWKGSALYMDITSGYDKAFDLNVTDSTISENNGAGVQVENMRSMVHVFESRLYQNQYTGLHVHDGVGDVNVSYSEIRLNNGDGVNITHAGGRRNVSRSVVADNVLHGVSVWYNETSTKIPFHQETHVEYSTVSNNRMSGVFVGNFCRSALVNVSGNTFTRSPSQAVQIWSCWEETENLTTIQIGHNRFQDENRLGIRLEPAVNQKTRIEYNEFYDHTLGTILVRNGDIEEVEFLPADIVIRENALKRNRGIFVVSLGLSDLSFHQHLLFTKNYVQENEVSEPFLNLNSRSRVAAVVVLTSSNVDVFRNILHNEESPYEIGSHYEDQSVALNCTYNYLGFKLQERVYARIIDRKDRYNLARVNFKPFLLVNNNPSTDSVSNDEAFVPEFGPNADNEIGGEIEGRVDLDGRSGNAYRVTKDIYVRPGSGELYIVPGVTLEFEHSVGMMVGGILHAEGEGPNLGQHITFTLYDRAKKNLTDTPVRLVGGKDTREGRLQVYMNGRWGTVCRMGWTIEAAALVCRQMGLALNPSNWLLQRSEMPAAGINEDIILSNVKCTDLDTDILECDAETENDFENSCTHEDDVGLRCYDVSWSGIRLGMTARKSTIKHATIEYAGLFDHALNSFKPALQVDFNRHILEHLKIADNWDNGLGIIHSDIYSFDPRMNSLAHSTINSNRGNGITVRTLGLQVSDCEVHHNTLSGIQYHPYVSRKEQREILSWLRMAPNPTYILPNMTESELKLDTYDPVFLRTSRNIRQGITKQLRVYTRQENVIAIYVLNPIHYRSTENIVIYDHVRMPQADRILDLRKELLAFPCNSSSYAFYLQYDSGNMAVGDVYIMLKAVRVQDLPKIVGNYPGPIPTLSVTDSQIYKNRHALSAIHYNKYLSDGKDHYLRALKGYVRFVDSSLSTNDEEVVFIHTPFREMDFGANMSEFFYMFNRTLFTENRKGIVQFSRDARESNNLFDWVFRDDTFEGNKEGGINVFLPYVWQYNENYTHAVFLHNNTFRDNKRFEVVVDGHFARMDVTQNSLENNQCGAGLFAVRGMEKQMHISENLINNNIGQYMVEFNIDSQSETSGMVPANFRRNTVTNNRFVTKARIRIVGYEPASYTVGLKGVQKINITHNIFDHNDLDYQLLAGIKTANIKTYVKVTHNWWGSSSMEEVKQRIFDFDDWNSYAVAHFSPFYIQPQFDAPLSLGLEKQGEIDFDRLGGRLFKDLVLERRSRPYIVKSDLTVMPGVMLTIRPGVEMEFYPSVGILVLGTLRAMGQEGNTIKMRPIKTSEIDPFPIGRHGRSQPRAEDVGVRLCIEGECKPDMRQGFVEIYNRTTLQWVPMCDKRFSERNGEVICRTLGFETLNVLYAYGPRLEMHPNSLDRVISWPEPLQCEGHESKLEECMIRMNGQIFGETYECEYDRDFLFLHCGKRNLDNNTEYWGGIRFSIPDFEQTLVFRRIHDSETHNTLHIEESVLEHVEIRGAGVLHGELAPAIESVLQTPRLWHVHITDSAWHGINIIAPLEHMKLLHNRIENNLGVGINTLVLNGEGQEDAMSSFTPLSSAPLSYGLFGLLDICDTHKEMIVEQRILLYYKYNNRPVDCVKIFKSIYDIKNFGFRFLYFNLYNSTGKPGTPDKIQLYDGDVYNVTSELLGEVIMGQHTGREFHTTKYTSLSVKLHASGGSGELGFIAEVITLPVSSISFGRDMQHNISYSVIRNNTGGAISYSSAGEVNPTLTVERNQFDMNGKLLYGNFTTSKAAVVLDLQNTPNVYFKNNLVRGNQGGLWIRADSNNAATALKATISNCLLTDTYNNEALLVRGRGSGSYQEVTMVYTYITRSFIPYRDVILLDQVVSNLSYNYIHYNQGRYIMSVLGFNKVRLPIFQTIIHNGFYNNFALDRDRPVTIVAGSAGQQYVDNVFVNPYNALELMTLNVSKKDVWKTPVDASHNWWGYNNTVTVQSRIRDKSDDKDLLEVTFRNFRRNNRTLLSGKCPPGHTLIGETCFIYIGAPMTFQEAKTFCHLDNASMPYLQKNYPSVYQYIRTQQMDFERYDMVWAQHYDIISGCSVFIDGRIQRANCEYRLPFLCETDTRVEISPLSWLSDGITLAAIGATIGALLLVLLCLGFWLVKSRHRRQEKLERRNSIRASVRSNRSFMSSTSGLSDYPFRQRMMSDQKSTASQLTGITDMGKMNGSLDSMEKVPSHMSSLDATQSQSFDTYETRNPTMGSFADTASGVTHPAFDLTFENRAFRDVTLSAANSRQPSREFWDGSTNTSTFKYHTPSELDSTADLKRSFDLGHREVEGKEESPPPQRSPRGLRRPPSMPPFPPTSPIYVGLTPAQRTKSQPLETAM
ncbi:unnamed protein product [Darwinula stevensoni]|uniref:SRCR domain-containing protein n=1 Tax=Darwinula stevensoni TaxID=69355 RepID=A0A7R9A884_9CRUS|nr:unnamed protein product [Darwinula stevensoni]CAG0896137.1 unnamed protein product [Darwinula stevensoni]